MLRLFQKTLRSDPLLPISKNLLEDLEIAGFLRRYFDNPAQYLTWDAEAIRERNEICTALLNQEDLAAAIQRFYDAALSLAETASTAESEPIQIVRNMIGVRMFHDAALAVSQAIEACEDLPAILKDLSGELKELLHKRYPENFPDMWNTYASGVEKLGSMAYHIHFSKDLAIDAIALSGVHNKRYTKDSFISRISSVSGPMRVDSLLSLVPGDHSEMSRVNDPYRETTALQRFSQSLQQMLFSQTAVAKSQVSAMERELMADVKGLVEELRFALGMVQYAKAIRAYSQHICFAEIRPKEERSLCVKKMVHPLLAEQTDGVVNDISIRGGQELILLGGVNQGGKTTYLRAAGIIQLLFQMGLPIPAAWGAISPASGIFSVFSHEENTELYQGKLGRELTEMRDAIAALDDNSLFLGNEPISATSPTESYMLSKESLCMLKAKYARGIWVTHLFGLFDDVEKLNQLNLGSQLACMRTGSDSTEHAYVIFPGKPDPHSGAKEVFHHTAVSHGLSMKEG